MAKLSRTESGLWTARKVIPADVREAYGKREDKPTWPASLSQGQAKAAMASWLAEVEERIAYLRARSLDTAPRDLTEAEIGRMTAAFYRDALPVYRITRTLSPADHKARLDDVKARVATLEASQGRRDYWAVHASANRLIEAEGLSVPDDSPSRAALEESLMRVFTELHRGVITQLEGKPQPTITVAEPLPVPPSVGAQVDASIKGPSIVGLFDGYAAERKPAAVTVQKWRRTINNLVAFLGHDDATRVTPDDVIRWKEHLLTEPAKTGETRSGRTVKEGYLGPAKVVFGWAKENRRIKDNPVSGVTVRVRKRQRLRDPGLSNEEALTILRATMEPPSEALSPRHALARRWVPWICAYSGARVNEITQARKQDIFQEDGAWVIHITPEAGSVKTHARKVPLHSHLIDQGFLKFVQGAPEGPLFYDPARTRGGSAGTPHYKKVGNRLGEWVRKIGVTDAEVAPNHGWRHRFKTVARIARIDPEAREILQGHALQGEGAKYGVWPLAELAVEVERLPRYDVDGSAKAKHVEILRSN